MRDDWVQHIEVRLAALEHRQIELATKSAVDKVHNENVADRLGHIEDTLKWLMRLIIGGLLVAGINFVMRGGLA